MQQSAQFCPLDFFVRFFHAIVVSRDSKGFWSLPGNWGQTLLIATMTFACLSASGCQQNGASKPNKNPKVVVAYPVTESVLDFFDFTGRLEAVKSVEIRARVSGYITEAPFKEGESVKQGTLLFQIDPRPFEADLHQAEANLELAKADRNLQDRNLKRAQLLLPSRAISREDFDAANSGFEKSLANVGAVEAAREKAKLYLDFTRVTSPLAGRLSRRFVDPGNLILADNTILTSIVSDSQVYAYFDVDERSYLNILEAIAPDKKTWPEHAKLPVLMALANDKEFDRLGSVDFVDNRVIASTGTVRMRGVFANDSGYLKAGFFVRVRLPVGEPYKAVVIPDEAIQNDQERKFVWIVNDKGEVEYRSVQLGQSLREFRVIKPAEKGKEMKEGLTEGDRVIISGMQRVRKGLIVDADMQPFSAPPENPMIRVVEKGAGSR